VNTFFTLQFYDCDCLFSYKIAIHKKYIFMIRDNMYMEQYYRGSNELIEKRCGNGCNGCKVDEEYRSYYPVC
jgi:hypothetical protein